MELAEYVSRYRRLFEFSFSESIYSDTNLSVMVGAASEVFGQVAKLIEEFPTLRDVDLVADRHLEIMIREYLPNFPYIPNFNYREFIKDSKTYYSSKGTVSALSYVAALGAVVFSVWEPARYMQTLSSGRLLLSGAQASRPVGGPGIALPRLRDGVLWSRYTYVIEVGNLRSIDQADLLYPLIDLNHPAGTKYFLNWFWHTQYERLAGGETRPHNEVIDEYVPVLGMAPADTPPVHELYTEYNSSSEYARWDETTNNDLISDYLNRVYRVLAPVKRVVTSVVYDDAPGFHVYAPFTAEDFAAEGAQEWQYSYNAYDENANSWVLVTDNPTAPVPPHNYLLAVPVLEALLHQQPQSSPRLLDFSLLGSSLFGARLEYPVDITLGQRYNLYSNLAPLSPASWIDLDYRTLIESDDGAVHVMAGAAWEHAVRTSGAVQRRRKDHHPTTNVVLL